MMERMRRMKPYPVCRRSRGVLLAVLAILAIGTAGCSGPWSARGQSPDLDGLLANEEALDVQYIGDITAAWGLNYAKVQNVALVTGLDDTGSDPPRSTLLQRLLSEMKAHQVEDPADVLASPTTALVVVSGYLPPGIQKGDRFDVDVRVPVRSRTTGLRNGFLMETRLRPMAVLGGGIKPGHVVALARGPLMVDSLMDGHDDPVNETRGHVLGGGVALKSRPLGLVLRSESHSVQTAAAIGRMINSRFHVATQGVKEGVATPKNDKIIELVVPAQYKNNVGRFFQVVRNMPVSETPQQRVQRIKLLENLLLEPTTSFVAALRLEAIGHDGVSALRRGLASGDPLVRYYSAEALAYLDVSQAVPVLADAARNEPALRWRAMTALTVLNDVEAGAALRDLLHVSSAETRYGAFRALRARSPGDPLVQGQVLGKPLAFSYHVVGTTGEPMIHFSRARRPEIVLFGIDQSVSNQFLYVGKALTIRAREDGSLSVSRYGTAAPDQHEICSTKVDSLLHALVQVGADYAEILEIMRHARQAGHLSSRLAINAVPKPGRPYQRPSSQPAGNVAEDEPGFISNPLPDLFADPFGEAEDAADADPGDVEAAADADGWQYDQPNKGFFGRMRDWFNG